jgi:hypothetical protein
MNAWDIKREAAIPMWQARIKSCRSSGMKVKEWCTANGIDRRTYYKWENLCLSRVDQKKIEDRKVFVPETGNALIQVRPEQLPSSNNEPLPITSIASAELVIHYGCVSMDISPQMPVARIAELVSALNSHV